MKTRKNKYSVDTTMVVNPETGELGTVEKRKKYSVTLDSDPFYMVFIDYIAPLFSLTNATSKNVLSILCTRAAFNTGKVSLSAADRNEIMETLNIKKTALSNCLKELTDKKLISGSKGSYIINPQIFWKGDLLTRDTMLKIKDIQIAFEINIDNSDIKPNTDFESGS